MPYWITVLLIVAVAAGSAFLVERTSKNGLAKLMRGRLERSDEEFYNCFFDRTGFSRDVVSRVRRIFQEHIDLDLSRLEADDDLSKDFKTIWNLDSMASVDILVGLEKEFGLEITDHEATEMTSIRKVIEVIHRKVEENQKC